MLSIDSSLNSIYTLAANGNDSALTFIVHFNRYVHSIDDIIDNGRDGKKMDPEAVISAFVQGNAIFSHAFYLANIHRLQPVVMLIANAYADSVKWEESDKNGERCYSDVLRFSGNEMLFAVALICGGYDHLRSLSSIVRARSWKDHHNENGGRH